MATIEPPSLDDVDEVESALAEGETSQARLFTLKLSQFKQLVRNQVSRSGSSIRLDIVLNGDWALAQFKDPPPHRIRVLPDNLFRKPYRLLGIGLRLDEEDFEIAAGHSVVHGYRQPIGLLRFIREERLRNQILLLALFVATGYAFQSAVAASGTFDVIKTANDVLIQVSAIFYSVFMLFVAAQGMPQRLRVSSFKRGLTHRFFAVDRYVSAFSLLALSLAAATRILVDFPETTLSGLRGRVGLTLNASALSPWTTALAATLMAFSLLAFAEHYLDRSRRLAETEMSKELLDEILGRSDAEAKD